MTPFPLTYLYVYSQPLPVRARATEKVEADDVMEIEYEIINERRQEESKKKKHNPNQLRNDPNFTHDRFQAADLGTYDPDSTLSAELKRADENESSRKKSHI